VAQRPGGSSGGPGGRRSDLAIDVRGLTGLLRDLRKAESQAPKEISRGLREAGRPVLATSRALAPRRSGALSRSIRLSVTRGRMTLYSTSPYSALHEYGGTARLRKGRMVPAQFMRVPIRASRMAERAIDSHREQLVDTVADAIERALQ